MSPKKRKAKNGKVDTISTLPDAVLSHILSFLPTTDAVATSILSKRWKYLWTLIHNLEFKSMLCWQVKRKHTSGFEKFVDRVLGLCQSRNIDKFHLCYYGGELACVHRWIRYAVNRNVRELQLLVSMGREGPAVMLPECISTCKSLVMLELKSDLVFDIPSSVLCFPSLKFLRVSGARYPDGGLMGKLFGSCPVLEDLLIDGDIEGISNDPLTFNISVPTLKKLVIELRVEEFEYCSVHTFVIKAPNLEYLRIEDETLVCYSVDEMPSLIEAYVVVGNCFIKQMSATKDEADSAMELLKGINNTKTLELSISTVAALSYAFHDSLPIFPNLTHLKLGIDGCFGWKLLPHFLKNSPNLEALVLQMESKELDQYEAEFGEELVQEGYDWIPPENVPSCLLSHLKTIRIQYIRGEEEEQRVIEYLLKNGLVLEKMSINFLIDARKEVFDENMMTVFLRGSKNCRIEFV